MRDCALDDGQPSSEGTHRERDGSFAPLCWVEDLRYQAVDWVVVGVYDRSTDLSRSACQLGRPLRFPGDKEVDGELAVASARPVLISERLQVMVILIFVPCNYIRKRIDGLGHIDRECLPL